MSTQTQNSSSTAPAYRCSVSICCHGAADTTARGNEEVHCNDTSVVRWYNSTVVPTSTLVSEISTFGSINLGTACKSLSKPIMTVSVLSTPYYVAVHNSSDIFVTSFSGHCVHVFDKSGKEKATIRSHSSNDSQFSSPTGIAISGDVMFVVENGGNRIQKLSRVNFSWLLAHEGQKMASSIIHGACVLWWQCVCCRLQQL